MSQFSINEITTFRWSFEEDVNHLAAAGISAVGIWRQKLSDFGEEKGIELLAEKGLRVSSLSWAGGFTGSDGRSFKESVADANEAVRLAGAMRAACLIVYSGARGGHTNNHARRLLKTALAEVLPAASEIGVTLAIEPMHPGCASECTFLTTLRDAVSVVEEVGHPQLKVALDCYHAGFDPELVANLSAVAKHIGIVQLGDAKQPPSGEQNRCRLGDGLIPLATIVERLLDAGYCGFFEVELIGEDVECFDYPDLVEHSQRTFLAWQLASRGA